MFASMLHGHCAAAYTLKAVPYDVSTGRCMPTISLLLHVKSPTRALVERIVICKASGSTDMQGPSSLRSLADVE